LRMGRRSAVADQIAWIAFVRQMHRLPIMLG
jgi:hypothetical protein